MKGRANARIRKLRLQQSLRRNTGVRPHFPGSISRAQKMGSDPYNSGAVSDERRTRVLEDAGFKVIRFWNNQILNEFEFFKEAIGQALEDNPPPSRPSP
jgi:hypothetical protein